MSFYSTLEGLIVMRNIVVKYGDRGKHVFFLKETPQKWRPSLYQKCTRVAVGSGFIKVVDSLFGWILYMVLKLRNRIPKHEQPELWVVSLYVPHNCCLFFFLCCPLYQQMSPPRDSQNPPAWIRPLLDAVKLPLPEVGREKQEEGSMRR